MNRNSNAAEFDSAAQERDDARASMPEYFSMDFKRILFCDAKGKSC